jgi:hypothetical protein
VGLFDFFKRRREHESALADLSDAVDEPSASIGEQAPVQPAVQSGDLGAMIQQAVQQGNVQQTSQTIDMRGSGLREEMIEIMKRHGIDPATGATSGPIDAASLPGMQEEMLEALRRRGLDAGGPGGLQLGGTEPENRGQ